MTEVQKLEIITSARDRAYRLIGSNAAAIHEAVEIVSPVVLVAPFIVVNHQHQFTRPLCGRKASE